MQTSDVVAIVAVVSVAVLVGATAVVLAALVGTLRDLRAAVSEFSEAAVPLLGEMREAVGGALSEVDRVERIVSAAEGLTDAVDSAQRLAYRTLASPVVKAMAFGAGVSRGARRLREGEEREPPSAGGAAEGGVRDGRARGIRADRMPAQRSGRVRRGRRRGWRSA